MALQRRDWPLFCALLSAASLYLTDKLHLRLNYHMLGGVVLGCVMVPILSFLPRNALDDRIGAASYGCYLSHWIFITALKTHYAEPWAVAVAMTGSAGCGWLSYRYIEAPTVSLRRAMRARRRRSALAAAPRIPAVPAAAL